MAAPAGDFYSPDIDWPDFERWVTRYRHVGNPVFGPASRLELAPYDALDVFDEARDFGFAASGVDLPLTPPDRAERTLTVIYGALAHLGEEFISAQQAGRIRAPILHRCGPRPEQPVAACSGPRWHANRRTARTEQRDARARTPAQRV